MKTFSTLSFLAYSLNIDTLERIIVLFSPPKTVSLLISIEGGKALSQLLNHKTPNI